MLFCICWVDAKCKSSSFQKCKMWSTWKIHDDFIRCPRNLDPDRQPPPPPLHPLFWKRLKNKSNSCIFYYLLPHLFPLSFFYYILNLTFTFLYLCDFLSLKQLEGLCRLLGAIFSVRWGSPFGVRQTIICRLQIKSQRSPEML